MNVSKTKGDKDILRKIKNGKVYIIINKRKDHDSKDDKIIEHLIQKLRLNGVYITLNRDCSKTLSLMKKRGIDISKLHIVGCKSSKTKKDTSYISFINNESIIELSFKITNITNTGIYHFLVFDSVSDLVDKNGLKITEKFTEYLINKLKSLNLTGIFIFKNDRKSKGIIKAVSKLCDKRIII